MVLRELGFLGKSFEVLEQPDVLRHHRVGARKLEAIVLQIKLGNLGSTVSIDVNASLLSACLEGSVVVEDQVDG